MSFVKDIIRYVVTKFKFGKYVTFPYSCKIGLASKFEGTNVLNKDTYFIGSLGFGSYVGSGSELNASVGRFTSIASGFKVLGGRHPYTYPFVTTCPMFFSLLKQNGRTFAKRQEFSETVLADSKYRVVIGNDVWIGGNVSIVSGTIVGDGAVLLAGCIVTQNIPPYAIVGGVPAKIIKYRYSQPDIDWLMELKWWNKPLDWLQENSEALCNIENLRKLTMDTLKQNDNLYMTEKQEITPPHRNIADSLTASSSAIELTQANSARKLPNEERLDEWKSWPIPKRRNGNFFKRLYRRLYTLVVRRTNPIKYALKVGVNFKDSSTVYVYGIVHWNTEPWLITIGRNVHLTDNVRFIGHDGGTLLFRDLVPDLEITKPITIGDDVYIGNDVKILPGVTIGSKVIIGTGAVVSKDIPDNSVAVGVPARVIKTADAYFDKIQQESLHLGHLKGEEKDRALMQYFHYAGKSNGIYF